MAHVAFQGFKHRCNVVRGVLHRAPPHKYGHHVTQSDMDIIQHERWTRLGQGSTLGSAVDCTVETIDTGERNRLARCLCLWQ